jgi:hypothetical protein
MNKSKNIIAILLFFCIVNNTSCVLDVADNKLKLVNNTNRYFYPMIKKDKSLVIKDTLLINQNPNFSFVNVGDTFYPAFAFKNQGGYIRKINEECLDSTMYLYLFEVDSVKKYGWDLMISNENKYVRKAYKVKDLDSQNWFIYLRDILK